jgi:hypothetical protein
MSAPATTAAPFNQIKTKPELWFSLQHKGQSLWTLVTETKRGEKTLQRKETEPDSRAAQLGHLLRELRRIEP